MIIEVAHDKCGVENEEDEKLYGEEIAESMVKLLTFGTWAKHELNGGEVEKKQRRKKFERPSKRRRKWRRFLIAKYGRNLSEKSYRGRFKALEQFCRCSWTKPSWCIGWGSAPESKLQKL
ncbi:hypothetical protein HAX54_035134 [Datura stramonium]|uniref:Uncharacterized protein n=1 Tax=Datura stramonium TaxID=4076 RepID=A0ABS8VEX4_DATST|nr:hypothetical protein [Datura stramonium]